MKVKIFTVLTLAIALFVSACGKSDADLTKAATDKLSAEKVTGVSVTVKDGVATLAGEIGDITTKSKAEAAVKSVEGIKSVTNTINVRTAATPVPPPPDQMLQGTTDESLKKAGCTGVTLAVKDGIVTASGTVPAAKYAECVQVVMQSGLGKMDNKIVKGK